MLNDKYYKLKTAELHATIQHKTAVNGIEPKSSYLKDTWHQPTTTQSKHSATYASVSKKDIIKNGFRANLQFTSDNNI